MSNNRNQQNEQASYIAQLAKKIYQDREMLGGALGVKFTYYPQSIKRLEERIEELYPEGERQIAPQMAVVLGVYFGETIRRNMHKNGVSVEWRDPEGNDIFEASLVITGVKTKLDEGDSVFQVKPLLRAYKYINVDRTDSMWGMYAMLQDMCHGRIQATPDKKWRETPRGYMYRAVKVDKQQN